MRLKNIELAWRRLWISVLTRMLARGRTDRPVDWSRASVLFLRHDRIGDMILSTGLLRAIVTAHPGITIDVLASPGNAPVLEHDPDVGRVIVFRRGGIGAYPRVVRALRGRRYDAVIDCMVTAPSLTTLLLMWASGARHRIGVADRGNDAAYTMLVPRLSRGAHMVERLGSLLGAFGIDPTTADLAPRIALTDEERRAGEGEWDGGGQGGAGEGRGRGNGSGSGPPVRLLVNVSAGRGHRWWPDERYVETVRRAAAGMGPLEVRVIAAPHEWARAVTVADALGGRAVGTPGVRQAFALVAAADVVFTPDTSIAHAASALQTPCVAMYVHDTDAEWGLYGTCGVNVVSPTRELTSLEVDPVGTALRGVLEEVGERTAR